LGALCKENRLAEVVDLEYSGTRLCGGFLELGRLNLGELVVVEIIAEIAAN
jgi:hypothetical protein